MIRLLLKSFRQVAAPSLYSPYHFIPRFRFSNIDDKSKTKEAYQEDEDNWEDEILKKNTQGSKAFREKSDRQALCENQEENLIQQKERIDEAGSDRIILTGKIFGSHGRLQTVQVVQDCRTMKKTSVKYIVDSGSPLTYLSPQAYEALGRDKEDIFEIEVAGIKVLTRCLQSDRIENGINILGADFLRELTPRASIELDFIKNSFDIVKKK